MKSIAAAVLMIAVSAWGQKPEDLWPDKFAPFCLDGYHVTASDANGTVLRCVKDKPKPHKPKPSVKTFKNTITPQLAKELASLPCDGFACGHTGLGDALPPDSFGPYEAAVPECKPTDPPSAECWRPRDKAAVPQYKYGDPNHIDWTLPCNRGDGSGEGGLVVDDKGCVHPEGSMASIEAAVPVEPCSIHDYYGRCDTESSKRHDKMLADAFAEYMSCMDQTESEGCYFRARETNGLQEEDFREHFHSEISDAEMYRILNERMARIGCRQEFSEEFCKSHVDDYQRFKKINDKGGK